MRGQACRVETNTWSAKITAAAAGLGLAVLPYFLARQAGLTCLLPELGADRHSRRVRVVAGHLAALFEGLRTQLKPSWGPASKPYSTSLVACAVAARRARKRASWGVSLSFFQTIPILAKGMPGLMGIVASRPADW